MDIRIAALRTEPPHAAAHADRVRGEQIKVVYRYLPALIVINAVVGAAMVYGLWDVVPHRGLVIWACAMLGVLTMRGATYWIYRRRAESQLTSHLLHKPVQPAMLRTFLGNIRRRKHAA